MSVKQTTLFPPPVRDTDIADSLRKYLFSLQKLLPLVTIDSSTGPVTQALPPAGLNSTTGQSDQNQEIIYKKISADVNAVTITGGAEGPQTLTSQYSMIRCKSDATNWWVVGVLP